MATNTSALVNMDSFDQLALLDTTKTTWRIKVRVSRMWPSVSHVTAGRESLKGYNLILLDDDNYHVHAFVYADNWNAVANKIEEGGLCVISNFYTKEAKGSLRPVSSKILINFSPSTHVEKIVQDDFMIPLHKFEFVDLGDLFSLASSYADPDAPEFSTDVIGVLEDFEDVKNIKTVHGQRDIVRFRITDGRHSSKITVWGDLAGKIDAAYRLITERPVIVIVTSTKLKIYKTSVQISTMPSSKIYFNLEHDSVVAMRNRLSEEGYTVDSQVTPASLEIAATPVIQTMSLSDLNEISGNEYIKKQVLCNVKVSSVEENHSWWYDSCGACHTEVEKREGKLYCDSCKRNVPVAEKKYRIVILGEDITEAFNFILMDRAAKRMLGITATRLLANMLQTETPNDFPPQIKKLAGKEVKLKLEISKDNVVSKSRLFTVSDAYDSANSAPTVSSTTITDSNMITTNVTDAITVDLADARDTPGSAKSTSKKIKMEK